VTISDASGSAMGQPVPDPNDPLNNFWVWVDPMLDPQIAVGYPIPEPGTRSPWCSTATSPVP
jgi:hypothetical protein